MSSGVIVGYDGSDCAKVAVKTAAEVAKAYGDKLTLVFGFSVTPLGGGEIGGYKAGLADVGRARLTEGVELLADSGVEVDAVIIEEGPAEALINAAEERDARVIVVGTRGESPWHGALIGSTPHKLIQLSKLPVLVVPLAGAEDQ